MARESLVTELRGLLQRAIRSRFEGGPHAEKVSVQAYVDGYMRALMDARLVDQNQLLRIIAEERVKSAEFDSSAAAA